VSGPKGRILVTGAAGFLGSHLSDALIASGCEVVGVDNLCTGRMANLEQLKREPRFTLEEHDICEPFDYGKVDGVFNLASPASPDDYARLGVETLRVGSVGTMNALDVARRHGATFLQASTSECYGDPEVHPQAETYWGRVNPVGPRSVYDEAKRFGEAAVVAYQRYYGVDTRLVRIFNTYGPRLQANDGRVISNFMMQALRGEDLTMFGDGSQTRSFCYVSDLVRGLLLLYGSREHMPVNIGNDREFTIRECAETVLAVTGAKGKLVSVPLPPERTDDPMQRKPDLTKARRLLGYEPEVGFRDGLERSLEYFKACMRSAL